MHPPISGCLKSQMLLLCLSLYGERLQGSVSALRLERHAYDFQTVGWSPKQDILGDKIKQIHKQILSWWHWARRSPVNKRQTWQFWIFTGYQPNENAYVNTEKLINYLPLQNRQRKVMSFLHHKYNWLITIRHIRSWIPCDTLTPFSTCYLC